MAIEFVEGDEENSSDYPSKGDDDTQVSFTFAPSIVTSGEVATYGFNVTVGEHPNSPSDETLDAEVTANLYVSGSVEKSVTQTAKEGDTVEFSVGTRLTSSQATASGETLTVSPIYVEVGVNYYGEPGFDLDNEPDYSANSDEIFTEVGQSEEEPIEFVGEDAQSTQSTLGSAYSDSVNFKIKDIEYEEDANIELFNSGDDGQGYTTIKDDSGNVTGYIVNKIDFEYSNPTIAIDGAGRFAKHEIIGGTTVRQKIGEDPLNISINGICNADRANKIDTLRDAKSGVIYSDRLPNSGGSLTVQFGSTSTEPMTDGGAADLKSGELLYSYSINCIEVIR